MNKENIFIDLKLKESLETYGYSIQTLPDFSVIDKIEELYNNTLQDKIKSDLYESSRNNSSDINNIINIKLENFIKPITHNLFKNITFYGGTFMIKSPINSLELPLHQDWNIVDECINSVYLIWLPIHNVNKKNGTIFLIEGSHKFFTNYRSGSLISKRINRRYLPKHLIKSINLEKGQYLIYNPAIFHGSFKNNTSHERIIATAMVTNKNAELAYYHKINDNKFEEYIITPNSYLNDIKEISNGSIPKQARLNKIYEYQKTSISKEDLFEKLNLNYNSFEAALVYLKNLL